MTPCLNIWLQSACALGQRPMLPARLLHEPAGGRTVCGLISVTTVCGTREFRDYTDMPAACKHTAQPPCITCTAACVLCDPCMPQSLAARASSRQTQSFAPS